MTVTYLTTQETEYAVGDAEAKKLWESRLLRDYYEKGFWQKLFGKDDRSIIQFDERFNKEAGDRVTFTLRAALTGDGIKGDSQLLENEEQLITYTQTADIDQIRNAVRSRGKVSDQRVPFSVREESKNALADWAAEYVMDKYVANILCGNTSFTFGQVATDPTSNRVLYGGAATSEGTIEADEKFDLGLIDKALVKAKVRSGAIPRIRKGKINGREMYVCIMHPYQARDLRAAAGDNTWIDIHKSVDARGEGSLIFDEALGMYNGVLLLQHDSIYTSSVFGAGGDVAGARALFLGAQSMRFCWARYWDWVEEYIDYKNKLGVATGAMFGLVKSVFNSEDFATITISTAAAA